MKLYFDNSVLNRPFDDQSQPQIQLETISFIQALYLIERRKITFTASTIIAYENSKNPYPLRRYWIESFIQKAPNFQKLNSGITDRAVILEKNSIAALDALHLASAEHAKVDYFLTCDYHIIKKAQKITMPFTVINPIDFIRAIT